MVVTLSTGEKVEFVDKYTHAMDKAFNIRLMGPDDKVTAESLYGAYDHALSMCIKSISVGQEKKPFSQEWLDELSKPDYKLLREAIDDLQGLKDEKGKKNS